MHLEVSCVAKASLEKAYSTYTDFESMPKWWAPLSSVRIIKREGDTIHLEIEGTSGGKSRKVARAVRLTPPDRVESDSEARFTRTKRTVIFEGVPEGTKITAKLDVQVKGAWAGILAPRGREEIESSAMEELVSFSRYVESSPDEETDRSPI